MMTMTTARRLSSARLVLGMGMSGKENPVRRRVRVANNAAPALAMTARSKMLAQVRGRRIGGPLEAERRDETSLLVHQIDDGGVVHGVAAPVERHFLVIDAIG